VISSKTGWLNQQTNTKKRKKEEDEQQQKKNKKEEENNTFCEFHRILESLMTKTQNLLILNFQQKWGNGQILDTSRKFGTNPG